MPRKTARAVLVSERVQSRSNRGQAHAAASLAEDLRQSLERLFVDGGLELNVHM